MTAAADAPDFEAALVDLQDHLPAWWAARDPDSNLTVVLAAIAGQIDALSADFQRIADDQLLNLASDQGLLRNFALAWGLAHEQLPTVTPVLRAYIAARAAEDGSVQSLIATLSSLIVQPVGGTVLTFPSGGGGLAFPPAGGFALYEFAYQVPPPNVTLFPAADGLTFPPGGIVLWDYNAGNPPPVAIIFPASGEALRFPDDGSGLLFGAYSFVDILENTSTQVLTVKVLDYLQFDRGAFARAVARFNPADWQPPVIHEVTSF